MESNKRECVLWGLVVFTLVGDLLTTVLGLALGLAESNPIMRAILADYGLLGMVALKVGTILFALCVRQIVPESTRPAVPAGVAFSWGIATCINLVLIL